MQYVSSKRGPKQCNLSNACTHTKVDDKLIMALTYIETSLRFILFLITFLQQNYERIQCKSRIPLLLILKNGVVNILSSYFGLLCQKDRDKVFKNGPSYICVIQLLRKNELVWSILTGHITLNFLKAGFQKFYLVQSWYFIL